MLKIHNKNVARADAYLLFATFATETQLREATRRIAAIRRRRRRRRRRILPRCRITDFNPHLNDIAPIDTQATADVAQLAGVADVAVQLGLHCSVHNVSDWHFDILALEGLDDDIATLRCHPPISQGDTTRSTRANCYENALSLSASVLGPSLFSFFLPIYRSAGCVRRCGIFFSFNFPFPWLRPLFYYSPTTYNYLRLDTYWKSPYQKYKYEVVVLFLNEIAMGRFRRKSINFEEMSSLLGKSIPTREIDKFLRIQSFSRNCMASRPLMHFSPTNSKNTSMYLIRIFCHYSTGVAGCGV